MNIAIKNNDEDMVKILLGNAAEIQHNGSHEHPLNFAVST